VLERRQKTVVASRVRREGVKYPARRHDLIHVNDDVIALRVTSQFCFRCEEDNDVIAHGGHVDGHAAASAPVQFVNDVGFV